MLDLRVNNTPLDLAPDAAVQITASNPMFDRDKVERIFSLPFTVPLTPHNRRTRRHATRLDAGNKTTAVAASVSVGTHLLVNGIATQVSSSQTAEEISVANTPLGVWQALQKIKINEILEVIDLEWGTDPQWIWDLDTGSFPVQYTIQIPGGTASHVANNSGEVDTAGQTVVDELNAIVPDIASYNSALNQITLDGTLIHDNPISLIEGMTINFHLNPALWNYNAVVDHVQDAYTTPLETHCFPMISWKGAYGQKNPTFLDSWELVNNVVNAVFEPNVRYTDEAEAWQNTVVPCPRVPYILTKIAEALGSYVWAGDVWDDADFQKLFVVSNLSLDEITEDQYEDLEFYKLNSFTPTINLNAHVPSMTAADFITALCNTFSLHLSVVSGKLEFVKNQSIVTPSPLELDGLVAAEYTIEPNFTDGWALSVTPDENEAYTDDAQLLPVSTGAGEGEILTAHTLFHAVGPMTGGIGDAKTPRTKQPLQCPVFSTGATRSTLPLTLLFCYEQQPATVSHDYIFASHDNINDAGDPVGAYTLSPDGDDGLYQKWHKGVIEYTVADLLSVAAFLHIGDIQKILSWQNARVRFYHPDGVAIAAVKEIQIAATASELSPTRLKLLY